MMKRIRIANLSYVRGKETFEKDGIVYNLKEFLEQFPEAYYKSGVWNKYTKKPMKVAIEGCNRSHYGADIDIEFDEKWENGEDGKCEIFFKCPSCSDMW